MDRILFFDGMCNLCNGFVNLLMRYKFIGKYAPLQGSTAKKLVPQGMGEKMGSVIYLRDGQFYQESKAIRLILKDSSGLFKFLGYVLSLVPDILTKSVYRLIAKNRYKIFGKRDSCRVPTPQEQEKFLP